MAVKHDGDTPRELAAQNEELRARLEEAEETLRAIRSGEVDALVVHTPDGERIFTLQGADHSYRVLVEDMNEGALSLTSNGMILYANRRFAAMLKTPLENVIGSNLHDWIAPEGADALRAVLGETGCKQCRQELSLAAADGTAVPVFLSVNAVPVDGIHDALGVVAADLSEQKRQQQALIEAEALARVALEDASRSRQELLKTLEEQRRAEQALRRSEARFRKVFETSPLGKAMRSMDGEVTINQSFTDILGYSEQEMQQVRWEDITHPDDVAATLKAYEELLDGRLESKRFEKRLLHKNGQVVWADVMMTLGRDEAGNPLYLLTAMNDITARKQADAALLDLKQHLQHNIEMERLRLAQNLHDVPLQELYGVIYKLEEMRARSEPAQAETLGQAIEDIQRTLRTLRATASELRPPALSHFGLEKAIRSYVQDFAESHAGIRVISLLASDRQLLPEDMRLVLFRVLQEALANIARHAQATEVEVRFTFDAEEARIEITDNGRGFDVPGDWVSMVREGHYGLAGMFERVSAAGGELAIESTVGGKTTVRAMIRYGGG